MDLGPFQKRGEVIFEYGRTVYDLLSQDDQLRACYARVVQERDRLFREKLEQERQRQQERRQKKKRNPSNPQSSPRSKEPSTQPILSRHIQSLRSLKKNAHQPTSPTLGETPESESRKAQLRERLQQNQDRSRGKGTDRMIEKRSEQVLSFYHAGQQAEERSQWMRALNHYKMCVK